MSTRSVVSTTVVLGLLAVAAVLGIVMGQGVALGQTVLVDATPETATNLVGDDHTVTATVTEDGSVPEIPYEVMFSVDGVNTGASVTCSPNVDCTTDEMGQVSGTYTGDGGVGTDTIEVCVFLVAQVQAGVVTAQTPLDCDEVEKVWEEPTPTPSPTAAPTPTPTSTPTPTPEAEAPDVLPPTGSEPAGDDGFPWAVAGLVVGGLILVAGGVTALRRAR